MPIEIAIGALALLILLAIIPMMQRRARRILHRKQPVKELGAGLATHDLPARGERRNDDVDGDGGGDGD